MKNILRSLENSIIHRNSLEEGGPCAKVFENDRKIPGKSVTPRQDTERKIKRIPKMTENLHEHHGAIPK